MNELRDKAFDHFSEQAPKYGITAQILRVDMPRFEVVQGSDDLFAVVAPGTQGSEEAVVQTFTIDGFKPEGESSNVLRLIDDGEMPLFYRKWMVEFAKVVADEKQVFLYNPPQLGRGKIYMIDPAIYMELSARNEARQDGVTISPDDKIFSVNHVTELEIGSVHGRFWTPSMLSPDKTAAFALKNILG